MLITKSIQSLAALTLILAACGPNLHKDAPSKDSKNAIAAPSAGPLDGTWNQVARACDAASTPVSAILTLSKGVGTLIETTTLADKSTCVSTRAVTAIYDDASNASSTFEFGAPTFQPAACGLFADESEQDFDITIKDTALTLSTTEESSCKGTYTLTFTNTVTPTPVTK